MKKIYKVLLIGSKSRTDIINKAKKLHLFSEHSSEVGMTSFNFDINKEKIILQLWEASCSDKFKTLLPAYCKDAQGVAFVFDLNQKSTFDDITKILPIAQSKCPPNTCYFLIGVKCEKDDERQVPDRDVAALVRQYHLKSAKFSPKDESTSILFNVARIIHTGLHKGPSPPSQTAPPKEEPKKPQNPIQNINHADQKVEAHASDRQQTPQSLQHQLIIAQKHEQFYKTKATDLEEKLKELTEKLEQSIENEKKLTEKVSYLTKKLHTVTLQKIHQEEDSKAGVPPYLAQKKLPILSVSQIDELKTVSELYKGPLLTTAKVTKEATLILQTFNQNEGDVTKIDSEKLNSFVKEVESVNKLEHPGIAKALGFFQGDSDHKASLLFEYYDSNLKESLKKLNSTEKVNILFDVCRTLKFVHSLGIAHKSLNPRNIMIDENGRAKLSEFGFASLGGYGQFNSEDTYHFVAPEILRNEENADIKADVYSFGAILLFVLTNGEMPAISEDELKEGKKAEVPLGINDFSRQLIENCIENDSGSRPSFSEIVDRIQNNDFKLI